jgi:uncharacterized protein (UPF0332 family)
MSKWLDISTDSLEAAKDLKESGRVRSSLSRAYYSAYALVTGELQRTGHNVAAGDRPNPAHEQLITMAKHNLVVDAGVRLRVAGMLRMLRQLRTAADYDPQATLAVEDAVFALKELSRLHRMLRN